MFINPTVLYVGTVIVALIGWIVGMAQANSLAWRKSVDRSQGYQRVIDRLEKQLHDSGQERG